MINLANELNKHIEKMTPQEVNALRNVLKRRLSWFINTSVKQALSEAGREVFMDTYTEKDTNA